MNLTLLRSFRYVAEEFIDLQSIKLQFRALVAEVGEQGWLIT